MKKPWITPADIKEYTDHKEVQERSDAKLLADITRAQAKIVKLTHNKFEDDKYPETPDNIRLATILVAEALAKNAVLKTQTRFKSETYDDYSYEKESSEIDLEGLGLDDLLSDYIVPEKSGTVTFRLTAL